MAISHAETNPEPIHPNLSQAIFFENERHIGFDPVTNDAIYAGSRLAGEFGPKIDKNTGEQVQRRHATTGEPLVGVRELKRTYQQEFIYKKISDGRGNVNREDCEHPDVLWARYKGEKDRAQAEDRGRELLSELGRAGLTADQILSAIRGGPDRPSAEPAVGPSPSPKPSEPEPEAAADPNAKEYPHAFGPDRWYLSAKHEKGVLAGDQQAFRGTRVEADEAALQVWEEEAEAKKNLDAVPAF